MVPCNPANFNAITGVKIRKASSISLKPPGMINCMDEDEFRDLPSYILSGDGAKSKVFR